MVPSAYVRVYDCSTTSPALVRSAMPNTLTVCRGSLCAATNMSRWSVVRSSEVPLSTNHIDLQADERRSAAAWKGLLQQFRVMMNLRGFAMLMLQQYGSCCSVPVPVILSTGPCENNFELPEPHAINVLPAVGMRNCRRCVLGSLYCTDLVCVIHALNCVACCQLYANAVD